MTEQELTGLELLMSEPEIVAWLELDDTDGGGDEDDEPPASAWFDRSCATPMGA